MILVKSAREIESMRRAGQIAAKAIYTAGLSIEPGVTTKRLDEIVRKVIVDAGGTPSTLGYNGYPAHSCISVNEQVIHGIPSNRRLRQGDIVSMDVVAGFEGFHGDCTVTFAVGKVSPEARRLIEETRNAFYRALAVCREGFYVSDISAAVQNYVEAKGYSVVRRFTGHGIGRSMHEDPEVPNFAETGRGTRLVRGMTLAIEPMVNEGVSDVVVLPDKWTVVTADGKLSAHYEHTVLITAGEPELLTRYPEEPAACK